MAITATDIHFRHSVVTGSNGNTTAFAGAGTSLGKYITNADITDATLNNLFDDVTGDQNAASQVDYACLFVYNANGSLAMLAPCVAWLSSEVAGGTSAAIAVDSTAASALGSASAQALQIASKTTAPAGPLTFSSPTTKGAGISVGAIPSGNVKALWVRRTAANTSAVDSDGVTVRVECDTAA